MILHVNYNRWYYYILQLVIVKSQGLILLCVVIMCVCVIIYIRLKSASFQISIKYLYTSLQCILSLLRHPLPTRRYYYLHRNLCINVQSLLGLPSFYYNTFLITLGPHYTQSEIRPIKQNTEKFYYIRKAVKLQMCYASNVDSLSLPLVIQLTILNLRWNLTGFTLIYYYYLACCMSSI